MTRSNKAKSDRLQHSGGRSGRGGDSGSAKKGGGGAHNWGRDGDEVVDVMNNYPKSIKTAFVSASQNKRNSTTEGNVHVATHVDFYGIGF
ncbi:UNVERIFIED_CONTAM: hypothetical protein HDU68_007979 [Siphonaria sp. JEL0065]|nr:hypothetical protein HDU68_007979 [Siphonaria sp. JEL0065]